ncbi:MAG TPA: glycosyltransferase [Paracoccaceae bacterium]|nr:glycosyltransferase [Paracoccaceae bacterium]
MVIPTYNEAENLPALAEALFQLPLPDLQLLIVDDNSPDGTGPVADPSPLELSRLSKIQLESRLGDIVFTRKKLDMLEGLYKEALAGVGR